MTIDGKTIVITRNKKESNEFISSMLNKNAIPFSLPTIKIIKKDQIVEKFISAIKKYDPDFSIFMSATAVKLLFSEAKNISKYNQLQLAIANTIVVAVGPKTKFALENENIKVFLVPDKYSSVGLGEIFTKLDASGKKVIIPRSSASNQFLSILLSKIGLCVKESYIYDIIPFHDIKIWTKFYNLFKQDKIHGIIFTSSSSVRSFFEILQMYCSDKIIKSKLKTIKIVAIGPTTSNELNKFNVTNTLSKYYTISGAIETMYDVL